MKIDESLIQKARHPCPKCGKKGLGQADHAHARGFKDFTKYSCRYCGGLFQKKSVNKTEEGQ